MAEKVNMRLQKIILEVVDRQMMLNNPPATRITFDRLVNSGHSEEDARKMIGSVLTGFIYDIMKDNIRFDEERYSHELDKLK